MTFAYAATATGTAIAGSISSITLTVTSVTGTIYLYSTLSGSGITTCRILYQQSGTAGGAGNYVIDTSQTVASFTGATATETVINQTGTDTSLAGSTGLTGVTTTVLDSSGGFTIYNFGFNRLNISGTLSIGITNPYEQLVIGSPYTQSAGATLNAYVQVLATGTLNLGATETAGSVSDGYQSNVLVYQPGSGYGAAQSSSINAQSNLFSGTFFGVAAGGTLNWKYGTISCWGGIGFNTTANINIGVSGSRQKPVLDYSRTRQSGSTTNVQAVYNFGTTNLYGLVFQGGSLGTTGAYGATWAQLKAPANFIGYEPRFCYSGFSGSTAIPAGTYTISNYAGNYGGTCDISKRSTTAVTYNFKNSALGTALVVVANASTGNFLVNAYQDLTVTGYSGAIICFQDSSNVFYQATATSSTASFTNILLGAQLNYLTAVWTQYFGTTDTATINQWAYDRQYGSASVQLRGVGGTTSSVLSTVDSNVTLSQTAANTILASNFTVNSSTGTITVRVSSTLDQLYDALKAWKCTATQANLIYPTIDTQPVSASGTVLSTAMSIVVNSGITLSAGAKFTSLSTSGTFTTAGILSCSVTASTVTNTGTLSSGITITGSVAQATPVTSSGVTITGNLTYNTNTVTTITLTSYTIGGTLSNSGSAVVTVNKSSTTIGAVGTNVTTQLVTGISLSLSAGLQIYVANGSGVQQAYVASSNTTYTFDTTGGTGTWSVKVAGYGYLSQSYTLTPASSGLTATVSLTADPYITQATKATVAAYTSLSNADQVYDYAAYYETTNTGIATAQVASKVATQVGMGSYNVSLSSSADSVWAISAGTVTIKSAAFSAGSTFTGGIYSTGTVTISSGITYSTTLTATTVSNAGTLSGAVTGAVTNTGTINSCTITGNVSQATPTDLTSTTVTGNLTYNTNSAIEVLYTSVTVTGTVSNSGSATVTVDLLTSSIGTVGTNVTSRVYSVLTLNGLTSGSQVYVADGSSSQVDYVSSSSTTYTLTTTGSTGTWTWKVTNYGKTSQSGNHYPATGSTTTTVSLSTDAYITQSNVSTVAAYTTLATLDQVYDYAAYYETTNAGIKYARVASKQGSYLSLGSYPFVFTSTGSVMSISAGTLNIKTTSMSVGATFTAGVTSTGSATFTVSVLQYPIIVSGASAANSWGALTNMQSGSSIQVLDNSGTLVTYLASSGTTFQQYIPSSSTSPWTWKVRAYGLQDQAGTFVFSGSVSSSVVNVVTDSFVVDTLTNVQAYTNLETTQKIYDYSRYFATTSTGIALAALFTKGYGTLTANYPYTLDPSASALMALSGGVITTLTSGLSETVTLSVTGAFTQGSATLSNSVAIRSTNLDSELLFVGIDTLTIYATLANAQGNISPGASSSSGIIRFLYGASLSGVTMSGTVYVVAAFGTTLEIQAVTLSQGSNTLTLSTSVLLQTVLTGLSDIKGTGFVKDTHSLTNIKQRENTIMGLLL